MAKPLTYSEKTEFIDSGNLKTEDFLKTQVEKIGKAIADDENVLIWNNPVFKINYMNPITKVIYNIENSLILQQLSKDQGFDRPFFLTAKQGFDAKLSNKGEKGLFIVHRFGAAMGYAKGDKDAEPGLVGDEGSGSKIIYKRASRLTSVFNLAQFKGGISTSNHQATEPIPAESHARRARNGLPSRTRNHAYSLGESHRFQPLPSSGRRYQHPPFNRVQESPP